MSADAEFKQFIDRILRCREAEDAAKEDTKAVYAEAERCGFDKARIGLEARRLRQTSRGWEVYFIAFEGAGLLKIGISRNVEARRKALSAMVNEDGVLLNCFPGIFAIEGWFHVQFAPWRRGGEWFLLCGETRSMAERATNPIARAA